MKYLIPKNFPLVILVIAIFGGLFVVMAFKTSINYSLSGDSSLENELIIKEKVYLKSWLIVSIFYIIFISILFILYSNGCKLFPSGIKKKTILDIGKGGIIGYLLLGLFFCIDDYKLCKRILKYKKYDLLLIKFLRSIMNAIISWLLIIIFIYNNINNKQVPSIFLMGYIALSIVIAFLYPLLNIYQYTFEEVEKHEKEK